MGNFNSKTDTDSEEGTNRISSGTIIGIILILLLVGFGIAVIVTSKKKTSGATNSCDTLLPPVTVSPISNMPGVVNVSWSGISGAMSYKVYRSSSATVTTSSYDEVKAVTVGTSVNFTGLTSPTQTFIVTSVNDCGESTASASSSIEMYCFLPSVLNLSLISSSPSTALASWDLLPYATAYKIFTLINSIENTQIVASDVSTYAISGSGTLTVAVNAMNSCAEGPIATATIVL